MHTHSIENAHTTKINSIKKNTDHQSIYSNDYSNDNKKERIFHSKSSPFFTAGHIPKNVVWIYATWNFGFYFLLLFQSLRWHRSGKRLFTLFFACSSYWSGVVCAGKCIVFVSILTATGFSRFFFVLVVVARWSFMELRRFSNCLNTEEMIGAGMIEDWNEKRHFYEISNFS